MTTLKHSILDWNTVPFWETSPFHLEQPRDTLLNKKYFEMGGI